MTDLFTLSGGAIPPTARVVALHGKEALSLPYAFNLHFHLPAVDSDRFDLAAAVGQEARLGFNTLEGSSTGHVHGILASVELVEALRHDALYRTVLVPRFWWLGQSRHSRIFVKEALPDVIDDVLQHAGLTTDDYSIALASRSKYPQIEHMCQYGESDLDFLSRWMEREGIYYYFEQGEDREKLVITDAASTHKDLSSGAKLYRPQKNIDSLPGEAFRSFRWSHVAQPSAVQMRDYNYLHPDLDVSHEEPAAKGSGAKVSFHGQNLSTPDEAKRLACRMSQELAARRVIYGGEGRLYGMRPGHKFSLEDHPKILPEKWLLATEVVHRGSQLEAAPDAREFFEDDYGVENDYEVEVTAIPAETQFRPPILTPTPRIDGLETAVVGGMSGQKYAQIDEHGRYLIKFHFDESDLPHHNSSMRVRMLQPHGGSQEGFHFPLRAGTEVFVAFLGGHPDRPVIAGVGPNAHRVSLVTADNATQNIIQSGSLNRIVMEDSEGQECVCISSPNKQSSLHLGAPDKDHDHNVVLSTDGDMLIHAGSNQDVTVGGKLTETVTGDVTETYQGKQTTHVTGEETHTVDGLLTETLNGGINQTINKPAIQTINAADTRTVKGDVVETITGAVTETITGAVTKTTTGAVIKTTTGAVTDTINGAETRTVTGGVTLTTPTFILNGNVLKVSPAWDMEFKPYKGEFVGFKFGLYGSKVDVAVNTTSTSAIKVDVHGVKIDLRLTKLDKGVFEAKKKEVVINMNVTQITQVTAVSLKLSSFHIYL